MSSSTSHRGSFDRGLLIVLFAGIAGAPLVWLASLQTGYVLAYQACDARSRAWVSIPTFGFLAVLLLLSLWVARGHRRARGDRLPLPLLGWIGVGMSVLMTIVVAASSIATVVLQPCD